MSYYSAIFNVDIHFSAVVKYCNNIIKVNGDFQQLQLWQLHVFVVLFYFIKEWMSFFFFYSKLVWKPKKAT